MASIDRRPNGRWRARWREYPGGPQRAKHFARKVDAERWLVEVEHSRHVGTYLDPHAGRMTVAVFAGEWMRRRSWSAATTDRIGREMRLHILPRFGPVPLASLTQPEIEKWVRDLPLARSSARRVLDTLSTMLAVAVADRRIPRNPAARIAVPEMRRPRPDVLTSEEVRRLAGAMTFYARAAVPVAAATGLRQGELFGLTVDRIDLAARTLMVDRQLWTPQSGSPYFAPPKTANGYRTMRLPAVAVESLRLHLDEYGPGRDGVVFHWRGRPLKRDVAARHMRDARERAHLPGCTWHDLRHRHASELLSRGVSPALVAERLGHDIKTLLTTYAHVIRTDDELVSTVVDDDLGRSAEDYLRTEEVDGDE